MLNLNSVPVEFRVWVFLKYGILTAHTESVLRYFGMSGNRLDGPMIHVLHFLHS